MKIIFRFDAINGCAKCRKWSGLRSQGALKVMAAMLSFDTAHKTSYYNHLTASFPGQPG